MALEELALLEEIQRRRTTRQSFLEWVRALGYAPAKHHLLIIDRLQALVRGETTKRKLMILCPPGSAKSTYASILFPPWFLAQAIGQCILACSYSHTLVESFGRRCRNLAAEWGSTLGYALAEDSKSAGAWATDTNGLYFCAGVGAGIAGHRADLGLIDDPVGSKEDADSKNYRDKQWEWFLYDFTPRLKPNAKVVLIMTRWNEDDLGGRLLEKEPGQWDVIRLPFLAEAEDVLGRAEGELLWPEWYTQEMITAAKQDSRLFSALYQQRPSPEAGNFFKSEMLKGYEQRDLPPFDRLRFYCASDHAISEKQTDDYTVFMPVGIDHHDNIWVLPEVFRARVPTDQAITASLPLIRKYHFLSWWAESGHISKSIGPFWKKRLREERLFLNLEEISSAKDKMTRAQSIHGRMSMGMVFFPKFASWWPDFEHELLSFPAGKHDDFVDALAYIGRGLDRLIHGSAPKKELIEDLSVPFVPNVRWLKRQTEEQKLHDLIVSLDR